MAIDVAVLFDERKDSPFLYGLTLPHREAVLGRGPSLGQGAEEEAQEAGAEQEP